MGDSSFGIEDEKHRDQHIVQSDWQEMCRIVKSVSHSWKCAIDRDDDETEAISDLAMEQLCFMADSLSSLKATTIDEISVKINLWRLLAPEEVLGAETNMPDAKLLISLLDDIESIADKNGTKC